MEAILMDKASIEKLDRDIEEKETELAQLIMERSRDMSDSHIEDRESLLNSYRSKEAILLSEIASLMETRRCVQEHKPLTDDDLIDLGDYVRVDLAYAEEAPEEYEFRLLSLGTASRSEVSVDSPLGKAVYRAKVGEMGSYTVNGYNTNYFIKAKSKKPFTESEITSEIDKKI